MLDAQAVGGVGVDDGVVKVRRADHPPGGAIGICEGAIGEQIAARIPGVGDGVPGRAGDEKPVRSIVSVRGNGGSVKRGGQGVGGAVAGGVVLVDVALPGGVSGGGEAVEGGVGVVDGALDEGCGLSLRRGHGSKVRRRESRRQGFAAAAQRQTAGGRRCGERCAAATGDGAVVGCGAPILLPALIGAEAAVDQRAE